MPRQSAIHEGPRADARRRGGASLLGAIVVLGLVSALAPGAAAAADPSFPPQEAGRNIYDGASVFKPSTLDIAQRLIDAIEGRSGAEVVVLSRIAPGARTPERARAAAETLMATWGIGRPGFDDGLVFLFDVEDDRQRGVFWLAAGRGAVSFYVPPDELERAATEVVLPYLASPPDHDAALLAGLAYVDSQVTPERTRALEEAVQGAVDTAEISRVLAFVGLVVSILGGVTSMAFGWMNRGSSMRSLVQGPYEGLMTAVSDATIEVQRVMREPDGSPPVLIEAAEAERIRTSIRVVGAPRMHEAFVRFLTLQAAFAQERGPETGTALVRQRDVLADLARRELRGRR